MIDFRALFSSNFFTRSQAETLMRLVRAAQPDTYEAASQAAMLALDAKKGDLCVRSDVVKTFSLKAEPASTLANWVELL